MASGDKEKAKGNDEADLLFRASIALNTLTDGQDTEAQVNSRRQFSQSRIGNLCLNHRTLVYRVMVFIILVILITLLETLLPNKTGIIGRLLDTLANQNGTIGVK